MGESQIELAASLGLEDERMQKSYGMRVKKSPVDIEQEKYRNKYDEVKNVYEKLPKHVKDKFEIFTDEDQNIAICYKKEKAIRIHQSKSSNNGDMYIRVRISNSNSLKFNFFISSGELMPPNQPYQRDHTYYNPTSHTPVIANSDNVVKIADSLLFNVNNQLSYSHNHDELF